MTTATPANGRLLATAFVAGPALLLLAALSYTLGVGLIPPGLTSWVEGILGSYALAFFVLIYLELSRRLSATHPRLAAFTSVTGLFGAVTGFALEFLRVVEHSLRLHGAGDAIWQSYYQHPSWQMLAVGLLGPLFPLTSILLGIGFLRAGTLPRPRAAALLAAGILFPLAQVFEIPIALRVGYPLAALLWLVALAPVGVAIARRSALPTTSS